MSIALFQNIRFYFIFSRIDNPTLELAIHIEYSDDGERKIVISFEEIMLTSSPNQK